MKERCHLDVETFALAIDQRLRDLPNLKTATLRALRREYSKRLTQAAPQDILQLALRLMERPGIEGRFMAYELISHHRAARASLRAQELLQLGRGIDHWGAVDAFACYLAGPAWREKQVPDQLIKSWARSSDRWWRRAALVSTVALNNKARGGRGEARRTLQICRLLVEDREDMVVKALSWALRELAKRDAKAARRFLAEHERVLAARVLREVHNKLATGLKNPRTK